MGERRAVRLLVSGVVQGVGFRYFARRAAGELGLVGWVRNLPDGRVEAQAAGAPAALTAFADRLRQGPPGSRVAALHEEELSAVPAWDRFEIVR